MNVFEKYFDLVSAEHYIPVYAVEATNNTTVVITERDIQDFIIEESQIKNIHHFSFFMIKKIERKDNLILINIDLKKSEQSYSSESDIDNNYFLYKFETNDASNFILYLNRALYRILTQDEIKLINVDECSKFIALFPPSSSSLNFNSLKNDTRSNNNQTTDSIQPFYVFSRFIEKVRLSNSDGNEKTTENLVSEISLKNLRRILKYKIGKINIFREFPDCSKYFSILLVDIIPFSKYITNLVFDSSINGVDSNGIDNYVECLIKCVERSNYLKEITFVGELPSGIENFFTKISEEKQISILSITFKNVQLNQQQLSILNSSKISSYRFSGKNFDSDSTLLNFVETTNIDLLSIKNSPQTDFLSNLDKFTNITVLSLCKNNIEIGDFFDFLSKNESQIQCLYLSGNKCEREISNEIKMPKFEEIRLDNISWGDFFLSYLRVLLKTQTFVDLSNSTMNKNEWNKVFNYFSTTSDGSSRLCKLLWNGNRVDKSFFSYLRKCVGSLDSLQIIDVIDQSTEPEVLDEFVSFLKEGSELINLFIGFSEQASKSMSGSQMKSILSALLINMKKDNSKKFYLSVPNSSSGDEGVDALKDLFNYIEGCKINFITFDGLQPTNPDKYTELCESIGNYVKKLRKIKPNSFEIQYPKNDLKFLKNKMQECDYKKLRQDFRFVLIPRQTEYLHSDFLYIRMVLTPILTKRRFCVESEEDDFFGDPLNSLNAFCDSLSDNYFENDRSRKKRKYRISSDLDSDEIFDSILVNNEDDFYKKADMKNNDADDKFSTSFSDDEIEENKNDDDNNVDSRNKTSKGGDDENIVEKDKSIKSKEKGNENEINSNTEGLKEDEIKGSKINNLNIENGNENDKSNENDISRKTENQKEDENIKSKINDSNAENGIESDKSNVDYGKDENVTNIQNIKRNGEYEDLKEESDSQKREINPDKDDKSSEKGDEENISDDNSTNSKRRIKNSNQKDDDKNEVNKIAHNNDGSTTRSNDKDKESINSVSQTQQKELSKTNESTAQSPQFEYEEDEEEEEQNDQQASNQSKHSKSAAKGNSSNSYGIKSENNQISDKLEENDYNEGNRNIKSNSIQNSINNESDDDGKTDQSSSIKNFASNKNQDKKDEKEKSKSRRSGSSSIKDDDPNENQIKERSMSNQKETDKTAGNNHGSTTCNNDKENESMHSISETQPNEYSKISKKTTSKSKSQIPQLEYEYEEEEEQEGQNGPQVPSQNKHSKSSTKHDSSNFHYTQSENGQNADSLNENKHKDGNKNHESDPIQMRSDISNKDDDYDSDKTAKHSNIRSSTTNKNQAHEDEKEKGSKRRRRRSHNARIKDDDTNEGQIKEKSFTKEGHETSSRSQNGADKIAGNKDGSETSKNGEKNELMHSKASKNSTNINTSQIAQFEFEYEEEQNGQRASNQSKHSKSAARHNFGRRNNRNNDKLDEIEYEEGYQSHKSNLQQARNGNSNKSDEYGSDKTVKHSSAKDSTTNRNQAHKEKEASPTANRRSTNSSVKDKCASAKGSLSHKIASNKESTTSRNGKEKEPISESHQGEHSKAAKKSASKNEPPIPPLKLDYDGEDEECGEQLAIGQKRHSPDMVKLSLYYSKAQKGQKPYLEIEYDDDEAKPDQDQARKDSSGENGKGEDEGDQTAQHSSVKNFTPNRKKGQTRSKSGSSSPRRKRGNLSRSPKRSRRKKKKDDASSMSSTPLSSITSLSFEYDDRRESRSARPKSIENGYYESDSGYDEHEKLVTTQTQTDGLTQSQVLTFEKVREIDLGKGLPQKARQSKSKRHRFKHNQSQCDDVVASSQGLGASRRLSLPNNGKGASFELVEDRGSDIEFPEMDEITVDNQKKMWAEIEEKFSLYNILHDIRANK